MCVTSWKRGGGVSILFREILSISKNVDLASSSVEALPVSVTHDAITIRLIVLHRTPRVQRELISSVTLLNS